MCIAWREQSMPHSFNMWVMKSGWSEARSWAAWNQMDVNHTWREILIIVVIYCYLLQAWNFLLVVSFDWYSIATNDSIKYINSTASTLDWYNDFSDTKIYSFSLSFLHLRSVRRKVDQIEETATVTLSDSEHSHFHSKYWNKMGILKVLCWCFM